jgi:hypothetical protein
VTLTSLPLYRYIAQYVTRTSTTEIGDRDVTVAVKPRVLYEEDMKCCVVGGVVTNHKNSFSWVDMHQ